MNRKEQRLMLKRLSSISLLLVALAKPEVSYAGPYQDDLIRCVGENLSDADKINFVAFISLALSRLPEMKDVVFIDKVRSESIVKAYAESIERLILDDCEEKSVLLVKFEGPAALFSSSSIIGQMALREKMGDPAVVEIFDEMDKYASEEEWNKLLGQ